MDNIWETLGNFEEFIYANERYFINEFILFPDKVMDIISVSFNESKIKYVFVTYEGQHIADEAPIQQFVSWYHKRRYNVTT